MDSWTSESKFQLPDKSWVRIEREQLILAKDAYWEAVGKPLEPRYFHDAAEIDVEGAAGLLVDGGYPVRVKDGVLVRIEADA